MLATPAATGMGCCCCGAVVRLPLAVMAARGCYEARHMVGAAGPHSLDTALEVAEGGVLPQTHPRAPAECWA
jgi:hypothetical protein